MKRILLALISFVLLSVAAVDTPQQRYIDKYAYLAVQEMYRSGIPASITLAQGLLESRYGLSELSSKGNNHFGIKCHDWKGKSMKVDDDLKGECFRVYDDAYDSFKDHSDFLRYRPRYQFLFDYDIKDYKSWAYGLSKAGYATDPAYPSKLIKYIEDYELMKYDGMKPSDFVKRTELPDEFKEESKAPETNEVMLPSSDKSSSNVVVSKKVKVRKAKRAAKKGSDLIIEEEPKTVATDVYVPKAGKATKSARDIQREYWAEAYDEEVEETLPESPTVLQEAVLVDKSNLENFHFSLSRKIYSQNGVAFVYSVEGDSYASIAESNGLYKNEILKLNDLKAEKVLLPGSVVYLQPKKLQTRKGLDKYIVETDAEDLWDICQKYGVKLKSIQKINKFSDGHVLREGDTVLLRK